MIQKTKLQNGLTIIIAKVKHMILLRGILVYENNKEKTD